ncbi:MAG: ribosome maturation factor RimM [Anaerolineae bacterium]|jgi:16S rRNA processing protein RimM|nr:ribosome maturation factor RimM [Anaerolineae bacterium]
MTTTPPPFLLLGKILRPHGIRGELRVQLMTDYPERITNLKKIAIGESPTSSKAKFYTVEFMRLHQDYGLLKLKTVDDRNAAELFRELFVMVKTEDAVPLADDEVYLYQLIGMTVKTDEGEIIGTLADVLETGANDVYVVKSDTGGEILIPVIPSVVLSTNTDERVITVHIPEGLLGGITDED